MTGGTRRGPLIIAAATASIAAAACYLVMLPAYAQTSVPAALWWALAAAAAQVALAVATLRAPSRFVWPAAGVAAAVAVASPIVRIATGADLKNVLWMPVDTTAGFTDVIDIALQLVAAGLLIVAALRWPRRRTHHQVAAVAAAVALMLPVALLAAAGITFATDGFTRITAPLGGALSPHRVLAPGRSTTLGYCTAASVRLTLQVFEPPLSALRQHPRPAG